MIVPKLAIFDMDGLIFDTERLFMNMKNIVLEEHGYPAREEDYVQTIGLAGENLHQKLIELYGADYPADEITAKARALVNTYMEEHWPDVKPGIRQLLEWFQAHNVTCCVASSTSHTFVEKYLKLAGLNEYFSYIIGGDEIRHSKPAPDIFLAALQHYNEITNLNIAPEDALVLEDSANGIRAAHAASIPVVCIPDMQQPSNEIQEMTAAVLKAADELFPLFDL